jgi:hypothetical protein
LKRHGKLTPVYRAAAVLLLLAVVNLALHQHTGRQSAANSLPAPSTTTATSGETTSPATPPATKTRHGPKPRGRFARPIPRTKTPLEPAGARAVAQTFLRSYLAFMYGHATARQLQDVTGEQRAILATQPPRVPASIRALRPAVRTLALEVPDPPDWTAIATITDGHNTYLVVCELQRLGGRWIVASIQPPL